MVPIDTPPDVALILIRSVDAVPSVSGTPLAELTKVVFAKLPAVVPAYPNEPRCTLPLSINPIELYDAVVVP